MWTFLSPVKHSLIFTQICSQFCIFRRYQSIIKDNLSQLWKCKHMRTLLVYLFSMYYIWEMWYKHKDNYNLSACSSKRQTNFLMRNMQASIHFIYGYCNGNNTRHRETRENKSQMTEQLEIPQTLFNEIFLERVTNHLCASEKYTRNKYLSAKFTTNKLHETCDIRSWFSVKFQKLIYIKKLNFFIFQNTA